MDAQFWNELLQKVLVIVLPALATAGCAWVIAWINKEAKKLSADQMQAIKDAVNIGVSMAEQTGVLKTGEEKKAAAITAAQGYLAKQGITVDLTLLDNMVESAVLNEINWSKTFTVSEPVASPTATVTVAPSMVPPKNPSAQS